MCVKRYWWLLLLGPLLLVAIFWDQVPLVVRVPKHISEEKLGEELSGPLGHSLSPTLDIARSTNSSKCKEDRLILPSLQWGWAEACNQTAGGDEACEVFLSSTIYQDPSALLETAMRSSDATYHPDTKLLKTRLVQAILANRPLKILALGPSTTSGRGCQNKRVHLQKLRWTDALQNLSNGSDLEVVVINEHRLATPFYSQWRAVLDAYKEDTSIDLVVVDYTVTSYAVAANRRSAVMSHAFLQSWPRPPAMLFLETYTTLVLEMLCNGASVCSVTKDFESFDPFYHVIRALQLPSLSYLDIACRFPSLNRTSRSQNGLPFLHAYRDIPYNSKAHYGCGVHLILAQALHLYLNKMLQDSCDPRRCVREITSNNCAAGFALTLQQGALSNNRTNFNLSREEACEMNVQTYWAHLTEAGFAAFTSKASKWHYGADRPSKFGWIANQLPSIDVDAEMARIHGKDAPILSHFPAFSELPDTDIVFVLHLSSHGLVFIEYLSSYENIGSASCRLEDLRGRALGDWVHINALWSQRMSIASRVTLAATEQRSTPKIHGLNATVRCREEGKLRLVCTQRKKFKLLGISSC